MPRERCESRVVSALEVEYRCEGRPGHEGTHHARGAPLRGGHREPLNWTDEQARKYGPTPTTEGTTCSS